MRSHKKDFSENEYRTGSSPRGRSYKALLWSGLVVVFSLVCLLTSAKILSFRIFSPSKHNTITALCGEAEVKTTEPDTHMEGDVMVYEDFGFAGQFISPFCQQYYELPKGIYITRVEQHSVAALQGVSPGDVLLMVQDNHLTSPDSLRHMVEDCLPGETITLTFSHRGVIYRIYLAPEDL